MGILKMRFSNVIKPSFKTTISGRVILRVGVSGINGARLNSGAYNDFGKVVHILGIYVCTSTDAQYSRSKLSLDMKMGCIEKNVNSAR